MRPAIYANHRRKDGSYPVKIVIYYKGKERKLATHFVAEPKDVTRTLHLKQGAILNAVQDLIIDMRSACRDIPYFDLQYRDVDFVVAYINNKMAKKTFRLDFFQFGYEFIKDKKEGTRKQYQQALNAFARYLKETTIDINAITKSMVVQFIEFLNAEPKVYRNSKTNSIEVSDKQKAKGGQASRHIVLLAAIYKAAKKKYNDDEAGEAMIPRAPFEGHELSRYIARGQKPLSLDIIQRMISAKTDNVVIRNAIDVAVVSLGLMGINLADMYELRPPQDNVLIYNRKKTRDRRADNAEMHIYIPNCIRPYIGRLTSIHKEDVWLSKLHYMTPNPSRITAVVNYGLEKWCESENVPRFTFYALRKSWGTIARRVGVDKALVDEGLAHIGDYALTDIYAERPWDRINKGNAKVLKLFQWPED